MPNFRFADGPCAGQTYFQVQRPPVGQIVPCGFHFYAFRADGAYHDVGTTDPRTGPSGVAGLDTKQIGKAWHRLMNVYAVEAPAALRRARAARARIRRLAR